MRAQNAELLAEKHGMEEAVTSLVRQTQELRHENEEQMAFLAQARDTIGMLKKEREAFAAAGGGVATGGAGGGSATSSLLDELEANVAKAQELRPPKPTRAEAGDGAPENCEEYFLIAQTAVKIGLAMKYPHKSDEVFRVRGIDLYYKCLNSHVPFHQWHLLDLAHIARHAQGRRQAGSNHGIVAPRKRRRSIFFFFLFLLFFFDWSCGVSFFQEWQQETRMDRVVIQLKERTKTANYSFIACASKCKSIGAPEPSLGFAAMAIESVIALTTVHGSESSGKPSRNSCQENTPIASTSASTGL